MNLLNTKPLLIITCLVLGGTAGGVVGALGYAAWGSTQNTGSTTPADAATPADPLYWVAPMDANYRRDKPGKSPMGMDLIPVYANTSAGASDGLVQISPAVVNNLGVRLATVERKPLAAEVHTVGYVQYNQDTLVHIHPRVEGWIEKLYVKSAGDPVSKNQPLYELYSPELVNAQEELLLALQRDNQTLVRAATERLKALQLSDATIKELRRSGKVKSTTTFYAPQQGVVDNLEVREGFYVKPGINLMSIGALDEVWVEAEVFERQASLIDVQAPVTMTLDYMPGRTWHGKVDYIYPTLDPVTRTLRLRLRFDNPDFELKPNMFAQITILSNSQQDTLIVPREAVIRTGSSDRVVLALGDGKFHSTPVRIGRVSHTQTEILDGLVEGQRVVSSAQFLLDSESSKTADLQRLDSDPSASSTLPAAQAGNTTSQQNNSQPMDHSQMDHSKMDHSKMNHSQMEPSQIDHSKMDHSKMEPSQMQEKPTDHQQMNHEQMNHEQMDKMPMPERSNTP
jgi:Cu(I)/Ag(I) efflux system membrane fusion protein